MESENIWKETASIDEWIDACKHGIEKWRGFQTMERLPFRDDLRAPTCKLCRTTKPNYPVGANCNRCPVEAFTGVHSCYGIGWDSAWNRYLDGNLTGFKRSAEVVANGLVGVLTFIEAHKENVNG